MPTRLPGLVSEASSHSCGHFINIGETNAAVAAKRRSVVLPDNIKPSQECEDCSEMVSQLPWLAGLARLAGWAVLAVLPPLAGWLGWLGWQDCIAKSGKQSVHSKDCIAKIA